MYWIEWVRKCSLVDSKWKYVCSGMLMQCKYNLYNSRVGEFIIHKKGKIKIITQLFHHNLQHFYRHFSSRLTSNLRSKRQTKKKQANARMHACTPTHSLSSNISSSCLSPICPPVLCLWRSPHHWTWSLVWCPCASGRWPWRGSRCGWGWPLRSLQWRLHSSSCCSP